MEQSPFSDEFLPVSLPLNFLDCIQDLSPDAILVLLTVFQDLSRQESQSDIILAFDLQLDLPEKLQDQRVFEIALTELQESKLLFAVKEAENPQNLFLIPGTTKGREIYQNLLENPEAIGDLRVASVLAEAEKPNIFKLYESNFGALNPMIAETIKADLEIYPIEWLEDAMKEAVDYNARNWRYVQAILRNWQEKGRKKTNEKADANPDKFRNAWLDQQKQHPK